MLGIGCPDRHALPRIRPSIARTMTPASSRESGFVLGALRVDPAVEAERPLRASKAVLRPDNRVRSLPCRSCRKAASSTMKTPGSRIDPRSSTAPSGWLTDSFGQKRSRRCRRSNPKDSRAKIRSWRYRACEEYACGDGARDPARVLNYRAVYEAGRRSFAARGHRAWPSCRVITVLDPPGVSSWLGSDSLFDLATVFLICPLHLIRNFNGTCRLSLRFIKYQHLQGRRNDKCCWIRSEGSRDCPA